ncbi:MAG: 3-deoxy-D-manno-octulosonic acid transferase [Myxococcaceae bacterium]|nr:3-deoxy-D-manno-octulosonic acid transferase [Myxococcaceae bacterium]
MRFVYVLASWVLFGAVWPLLWLMRKTRDGWRQRLGFLRPEEIPPGDGPLVWLHGASAGDLLALSPMIRKLRQRSPGTRVLLSTITNTGILMARERLRGDVDGAIYAPWDLLGSTRRAVQALKPKVLVLEYTEIWPNLIHAAKAHGAQVVLTNGRFGERRLGQYRALFALIGNPLRELAALLMRDESEAERALKLGAPAGRVQVTGNTKFDALIPPADGGDLAELRQALALPETARVLMAGSTHEGEEPLILEAYVSLLQAYPDLRLVIAPRYLERAERVAALVRERGLSVGLRSRPGEVQARVMILDTIGELARAYRLATLVFVGGSFTTRGGQNILEPAAQGRPVLFGPHMENFRDSVTALLGRGGIQVKDAQQLAKVVGELLSRPDQLQSLGSMAKAAVAQLAGASDRNVDQLCRLLEA